MTGWRPVPPHALRTGEVSARSHVSKGRATRLAQLRDGSWRVSLSWQAYDNRWESQPWFCPELAMEEAQRAGYAVPEGV